MNWAKDRCCRHMLLAAILMAGNISAKSGPKPPAAPKALRPPKGEVLLLHLIGQGKQIYVCQNNNGTYAWTLKAPEASLFTDNGEAAGRHFAGPTWEAKDKSQVTGKLVASVRPKKPDAIPWLLLEATSHNGKGIMTNVASIQRLHTQGGVAPSSGCGAAYENEETSVAYEADYYFYKQR